MLFPNHLPYIATIVCTSVTVSFTINTASCRQYSRVTVTGGGFIPRNYLLPLLRPTSRIHSSPIIIIIIIILCSLPKRQAAALRCQFGRGTLESSPGLNGASPTSPSQLETPNKYRVTGYSLRLSYLEVWMLVKSVLVFLGLET